MAGGACPEGYACIEISAALALSEWHKAIVMWVQEAWSKCGPQPPATDITTKT